MSSLSDSAEATLWLSQFNDAERPVAASLVDELLLVGADEFHRGMKQLLDQVMASRDGRPAALYAEREVETEQGAIRPIFGEPGDRRATGLGPAPLLFDPKAPEVGSEGPIANLITGYQRLHGDAVLDHPGPDLLRDRRAGPIVIVADFIGSGNRVWEMLEAFRAVRSVRSWHSYRLVDFYVLAYSGTEEGIALVRRNRLRPKVLTVAGCPTLQQAFRGEARDAVLRLCYAYPPNYRFPLGFGASSALIAFAHGIPDNAPAILHSDFEGWKPLFPNRSALASSADFPPSNREELVARSAKMLRVLDAQRYLADSRGRRWIQTMLVLAALDAGARTRELVSAQTRISLGTVDETLEFTRIARWTRENNALTPLGRAELQRLRRRRARMPVLPTERKPFYYPTQLRAR
ncbi:hypothetical protein BV96_01838 [Sphingomonas paucimobilis]|nr:hypothetical protein BV96_01838 [Sphingomonas paucimobilis]